MTKRCSKAFAACAALASCLIATAASAQDGNDPQLIARGPEGNITFRDDAAGFGQKGQWVFSTDAQLGFSRTTGDRIPTTTEISILPALDYFVIQNLSVGGVAGVEYTKAGDTRVTVFQLGPRVGYNFEVSGLLSIWPRGGISYRYTKAKIDVGETQSGAQLTAKEDGHALGLNLFVPIMLHPAEHFFAGLGPFLETDLSGDNQTTSWGVRLTVGGWM